MEITIRAEENALLIWNERAARTAYVDGKELEALIRWAHGGEEAFADRLMQLGLMRTDLRGEVLMAASKEQLVKAPLRSFSAPESLHIELTERCLLSCPQCYKGKGGEELSGQRLSEILRQAADMKVFQIALGGGEPMVYPGLNKAVGRIKELGMSCSITTSGYGLNAERLSELVDLGANHIQISLNGSCPEIHNRSRDGFQYGEDALKLLCERRSAGSITYGINWVARMDNVTDFPALVHYARFHRVHNINILRYKPSPNEDYASQCLTADKQAFLEKCLRSATDIPIKVDSAYSCMLARMNRGTGSFSGCGAGRRFLAVDASGFFRPCSHISMREEEMSLRSVWYGSRNLSAFRELEDKIGQPCRSCAYLNGCRGCRAVVLAQGGEFYAGETGELCLSYDCCNNSDRDLNCSRIYKIR